MDEEPTPETTLTEEQLAAQLRTYADALESARADTGHVTPAVVDISRPGPSTDRARSPRILGAAAAVVAVVGAFGWLVTSGDGSSVSTDTPPTTSTTLDQDRSDSEGFEPGSEPYLLPDLAAWAVVDHSEVSDAETYEQNGIWVWRLNGHLVTLTENAFVEDPKPRPQATVDVSNNRTTLAWVDGETSYDLQGIDLDEATLRTALETLTRTGDSWKLPGADLVASDNGGKTESANEQLIIVPRDDDGIPKLAGEVYTTIRPGSPADLYRELHEASGSGTVSDAIIAGEAGFTIDGPEVTFALLATNGWVLDWWTTDADLDLTELLGSLRSVTPGQWDEAVAGIDDAIAEVITAADIEPAEAPIATAELPRYTLPEPWEFEWVTDMGIWTPEQHAQRQALDEAHTPAGAFVTRAVRAQGFRQISASPDLPIAVPDVVIEIREYEGESPSEPLLDPGEQPYALGDLEGATYRLGSASGEGAAMRLAGESLFVNMRSANLNEAELRTFADTLTARGGDPRGGFDATSNDWEELFEIEGPEAAAFRSAQDWHAAWRSDDSDLNPRVSVERLSLTQLQWRLMGSDGELTNLSSIDSGRYLAIARDVEAMAAEGIFMVDDQDVMADDRDATNEIDEFTTLMHHEAGLNILTTLSVNGTADEAVALMEQLSEVDRDEWIPLVAPVNSDPLHPR